MLLLLSAFSEGSAEWRHGYDLIKQTGILSGTLYPLLMRMTEQGIVESKWMQPAQPGRPPRHLYRLTAAGAALAQAAGEEKVARRRWAVPA